VVALPASQNPDGGWPYQHGGLSWTEPTAYALLALMAQRSAAEPIARGLRWLRAAQLADGGWPPQLAVRQSNWVTGVAALLGPVALGEPAYRRSIAWLLQATGEDANPLSRAREFLTGRDRPIPGWSWFPGTSSWVTPTSISMLALRKAQHFEDAPRLRERLNDGASYLLVHMCSGGGWNYGAARALDNDARPYPETTGVALLALTGMNLPNIQKSCAWAVRQLSGCQTSEGQNWLRLGLLAHGQLPTNAVFVPRMPRNIQNVALALLAECAGEGRNPFLE
jgi:hypothetical protein